MRVMVCFLMLMSGSGLVFAEPAPWTTLVVADQSEMERLAVTDLQRCLAQVYGRRPQLTAPEAWQAHPGPALVIGTPQSNDLLAEVVPTEAALGEEGYCLMRHASLPDCVIVVAKTPRGVVNGIYGLLRELGFGFFLGSESVPKTLPQLALDPPIVRRPLWQVRGVLPWYNFVNSPTAWDPVDHRALIDQLIRLTAASTSVATRFWTRSSASEGLCAICSCTGQPLNQRNLNPWMDGP